jgi:hypothetical protein
MKPDMSPASVESRLRHVAAVTSLDPRRRLEGKVAMDATAILVRLRQVSELRNLGLVLVAAGRARRSAER